MVKNSKKLLKLEVFLNQTKVKKRITKIADQHISSIPRGPFRELRITLSRTENGRKFLNLREFQLRRDGKWYPHETRGIAVRLEEFSALRKSFQETAERVLADEPDSDPELTQQLRAIVDKEQESGREPKGEHD